MRFAPPLRSIVRGKRRYMGVTLVELVVVITISGLIATILGVIIVRPIQGYQMQVRRTELVDAAEMSLRRLGRDIRQALPNSVRVDPTGRVIEMLNTVDGARYREGPGTIVHPHGATQYRLKFNGVDTDGFNIIGTFQNITVPFNSTGTQYRLAIYNQGVTGADAYADAQLASGPYVITNPTAIPPTTFSIADDGGGDEQQILPLTGTFNFRWASPNQRVFIVDTPVTYVCSPGIGGTITRYANYAISATQPTNPAVAPLTGNGVLLATPVTACTFTYTPGTNQRAGLVTLDITVSDTASGDLVRLLYQAHVDNSP